MQNIVCFFIIFLFLINSNCEEKLSKAVKLYNGGDIMAPTLTRIKADTAKSFIMEFNEPLSSKISAIEIDNNLNVTSAKITENTLSFEVDKPGDPGKEYTITASVQDLVGNSALIVEKIYGFNPRIPMLLINEFITEGSKKNPDKVEILSISDGNTAGITLQEGGIRTYKQRVILPAIQVKKNDFIIVHFRAPKDAVSETTHKGESKLDIAYEEAWDVFHSHEKLTGIGNSNGALVLLKNPNGDPLDAVIYSNKKDDTTKEKRGFIQKEMYAWVKEIETWNMWQSKNASVVFPSDTLDPTNSTTTRSINRKEKNDTNSVDDWYIVNTRKSTFGATNSTEVYTP